MTTLWLVQQFKAPKYTVVVMYVMYQLRRWNLVNCCRISTCLIARVYPVYPNTGPYEDGGETRSMDSSIGKKNMFLFKQILGHWSNLQGEPQILS